MFLQMLFHVVLIGVYLLYIYMRILSTAVSLEDLQRRTLLATVRTDLGEPGEWSELVPRTKRNMLSGA